MQGQIEVNSRILERFEFRDIRQEEADQAVLIEKICFPPNEACSEKHMKERIGELQRTRKNSEMNFLQMHL